MPPSHLVVNYHRIRNDYDSFHLAIFPPSHYCRFHKLRQARPHALSAFGAVFRVNIAALELAPRDTLHLLPVHGTSLDHPDGHVRRLDLASFSLDCSAPGVHHVFIAEGDTAVHTAPHRFLLPPQNYPRFLSFVLPFSRPKTQHSVCEDNAASVLNTPVLNARLLLDSATRVGKPPSNHTVFPATPAYRPPNAPLVYILDLAALPHTGLTLAPVLVAPHDLVLPLSSVPPALSDPTVTLPPTDSDLLLDIGDVKQGHQQRTSDCIVHVGPYAPQDVMETVPYLLAKQVEQASALSPYSTTRFPPPHHVLHPHPIELQQQPTRSAAAYTSEENDDVPSTLTVYLYGRSGEGSLTAAGAADGPYNGSGHDPTTPAGPSLTLTPVRATASVPPVSACAARHGSARVFEADLSALSRGALADGLLVSTPGTPPLRWTPVLGGYVIVVPGSKRLLTPADTDIRLVYHRMNELLDWAHWTLRLWTEGCSVDENAKDSAETDDIVEEEDMDAEQTSASIRPISLALAPNRPVTSGQVWFNLSDCPFPDGVEVQAKLVRHADPVPEADLDQPAGLDIDALPPVTQTDVVRSWTAGKVSHDLHIVQGDSRIYATPPKRSALDRVRRIRIRYRRFLPDDYDGWDLWTWDDADPPEHRVAVQQQAERSSRAWTDFIVDRSAYGAGACLSLLPRRGGEEWLEKDEPLRIWTEDLIQQYDEAVRNGYTEADVADESRNYLATFFISQATNIIFTSLRDVTSSALAYVTSVDTLTVKTAVPISWVCPPRPNRPRAATETTFKLHGPDFNGSDAHVLTTGKVLRFNTIREVSPIETEFIFRRSTANFEEDFLVEQTSVCVPGFDQTILQWQHHEDWDLYHYSGVLGWQYTPEYSVFRCFAPTADLVKVVLYTEAVGDTGRKAIPMRQIPQGCWKVTVAGNLEGTFYKLLAEGENKRLFPGVEVIDPYSRCNTAHNGRGLIFGKESTVIHPRPNIKPADAIVYELHIRDFTIDEDSGISKRGKFKGLTERGTHMNRPISCQAKPSITPWTQEELPGVHPGFKQLDKFSTGLDHIAQMGVTAVQILPIQDFDNDENDDEAYRWGYMPVHYNSPDGWFASDTNTVARVTEFKQLVDAIHKAGMKVIMDVVYNHTAEDSNEFNLQARFSFNGIVPRYYYRTCGNTPVAHNGDSTCARRNPDEPRCGECYSNGSGCGNEFRSESPMGRKFIIDSLKYWASEYQVDGFRFDLLGLIDVETLAQAAEELKMIDPNIMIYGEPWCGGLSPIQTTEKGMQRSKGFGVFNNTFRDAIRGSPFDSEETFVMDGGRLTEVKSGIVGSIDDFCDNPLETINYIECHDNYTLWDHFRFYIRSRVDNINYTEDDMRRMHKLAALLVFTSQGVPFMQAGQEMCRTKFDVENSYESPDNINMIRWSSKTSEWPIVQYYRGLILLRRSHPELFSKETAEKIRKSITFYDDFGLSVPDRCIAYHLRGDPEALLARLTQEQPGEKLSVLDEISQQWTEVVILLNATPNVVAFDLPDANDDAIWLQVVDASQAGVRDLRGPAIGSVTVEGRAGAVLRRASKKDASEAQLNLRLDSISDSYSSFQGDDSLSRYSVGLDKAPSREEANAKLELEAQRNVTTSQNGLTSTKLGSSFGDLLAKDNSTHKPKI